MVVRISDKKNYGKVTKLLVTPNKIVEYIERKYDYTVEDDEKMYLLLHLVKLTS